MTEKIFVTNFVTNSINFVEQFEQFKNFIKRNETFVQNNEIFVSNLKNDVLINVQTSNSTMSVNDNIVCIYNCFEVEKLTKKKIYNRSKKKIYELFANCFVNNNDYFRVMKNENQAYNNVTK